MSWASSFRLTLDEVLPVRSPLATNVPRVILSLSPTNTKPGMQSTANCKCAPLGYLCTPLSTRKPMHVCPPPQFQRICHFLCYICFKVSIWCAGLTWWPVINFYSSAACAAFLTAGNYVAGRLGRHKENHTFDLCESLTIHDGARQHMVTKRCATRHAFFFFF